MHKPSAPDKHLKQDLMKVTRIIISISSVATMEKIIEFVYSFMYTIVAGRDEFLTASLTLWIIYNQMLLIFFIVGEG